MNTIKITGSYSSIDEIVQPLGQEWLSVPEAWEWGLDDYLIVQTQQSRLVLCRVEQFSGTDANGYAIGGVRKVPIKWGELDSLGEKP